MPIWKDEKRGRRDYVEVPPSRAEDLWMRCQSCGELVFRKKLAQNNYICPHCGAYFFLSARERIESLLDEGFADITPPLVSDDPLGFVDRKPYVERIAEAQRDTGLPDALMVAEGKIEGHPVVIAAMDFRFIGGSMGSVVGEGLCRAMERAVELGCAFIFVAASGGARVQEGVIALLQMPKTVLVRGKLSESGIPYIAVFTYPTTGGVLASLASLADIVIAERGTKIGFAGPRVIEQTTREKLPPDFQTDYFALAHGIVDKVVPREKLREELARILSVLEGARYGG